MVIDRIAADVDEFARARRVQDLDTAAVLADPRAERRRRLAEPDQPAILTNPDEYLADPGPQPEVFSMVRNPLPTSSGDGTGTPMLMARSGHAAVRSREVCQGERRGAAAAPGRA